jgi:hypothetical protein
MDVVYVVGPGEREWLRYSLRSLDNLPHDQVWIVGECPNWVNTEQVNFVRTVRKKPKWVSATLNMKSAALNPAISEDIVLMNDDFFVTQPIDSVPVLHRGYMTDVVESVLPVVGNSSWAQGMRNIGVMLEAEGYAKPLCYELHVPMPMQKQLLREAIEWGESRRLPTSRTFMVRTIYGNIHSIGGDLVSDVKIYRNRESIQEDMPFRSSAPTTWNTAFTNSIRSTFPRKSKYELY